MTELELVGRDVDTGELEVGVALPVEDQERVGGVAAGGLDGIDQRLHLEDDGNLGVGLVEQADRVAEGRRRRHLVAVVGDREAADLRAEARGRAAGEVGRAQHVALGVGVARLRVGGATMLVAPRCVLLQHQAKLTPGLAIARGSAARHVGGTREVRTVAARQRVEELRQRRLKRAADGSVAEGRERHQVAVVFARPVDQAVAAGVGDQHVAAGAAEGAVFVAAVVDVGPVVQAIQCPEVVVGIEQVVAEAAVDVVAAAAADQPVVAQVAEDLVVAVGVLLGGEVARERALRRDEVQEVLAGCDWHHPDRA